MGSLDSNWEQVEASSLIKGWKALRVAGLPPTHDVFIAKDGAGYKHLLILTRDAGRAKPWKTRGLEIGVGEFGIGSAELSWGIRVSCTDKDFDQTFSALVEAIVRAVATGK